MHTSVLAPTTCAKHSSHRQRTSGALLRTRDSGVVTKKTFSEQTPSSQKIDWKNVHGLGMANTVAIPPGSAIGPRSEPGSGSIHAVGKIKRSFTGGCGAKGLYRMSEPHGITHYATLVQLRLASIVLANLSGRVTTKIAYTPRATQP